MISVRLLSKSFGKVKALQLVSFEVPSGTSLSVLGPSGSGKTTLLRLVAGLEIPDEGIICLDGQSASCPGWVLAPQRRGIGCVFQRPVLWPHMTVSQNILFGLSGMPRADAQDRAAEMLEMMELTPLGKRYPHTISGGEAGRVAIARCLAPHPRHVLMDEPLTHLDHRLKIHILGAILTTVHRIHADLIYITHDIHEAEQIDGGVLTLEDGRVAVIS